jgi:hypothetical protein
MRAPNSKLGTLLGVLVCGEAPFAVPAHEETRIGEVLLPAIFVATGRQGEFGIYFFQATRRKD